MTDQTIPQAAVEAAARAMVRGVPSHATRDRARAALTAALPLLSVPEATRLRESHERIVADLGEQSSTLAIELIRERDEAVAQVERVRALADEWQKHHDEQAPNAPSLIYGDGASMIRRALTGPDERPNRCPSCGSLVWFVNPRGRCCDGWHADPTAARTPDDDAEGKS